MTRWGLRPQWTVYDCAMDNPTPLYDETIVSTKVVPHPEGLDPEELREAQLAGVAMVFRAGMAFVKGPLNVGQLVKKPGVTIYNDPTIPERVAVKAKRLDIDLKEL